MSNESIPEYENQRGIGISTGEVLDDPTRDQLQLGWRDLQADIQLLVTLCQGLYIMKLAL